MNSTPAVRDRLLEILSEVTNCAEVQYRDDLPLYESGLLDSFGTVSLMLALGEEFGVTISPSEFDAAVWATTSKFVADVERRIAAQRDGKG